MKLSSLEAIVSALRSADVRYLIVGGLAVAAHGHGRATFDVDDLFVDEPFDFDTEYGRAMIGDILPDLPVRFVCLETLLRMKELAGRPKDLEDIRQLRLLTGDDCR